MEQETGQPVVTAKDAQDLQQLVTGAVESAAELAEGTDDVEEKGDEAVNRREWKELFESRILQRGSAYYKEGAVETLWREAVLSKRSYWEASDTGWRSTWRMGRLKAGRATVLTLRTEHRASIWQLFFMR